MDIDDFDSLQAVITNNAPSWTQAQRDELAALARAYVLRECDGPTLVARVVAVQRGLDRFDANSSWSVFSTWLVQRAGRLGQRLRAQALGDPTP